MVVNTSSISGLIGQDGIQPMYNASKGAVWLLTKSAAIHYSRHEVRCTSVHPGPVDTPMCLDTLVASKLQRWKNG